MGRARGSFAGLRAVLVLASGLLAPHVLGSRAHAQAGAASMTGVSKAAGAPGGVSIARTTRIEDPGHKLDGFYAALDATAHAKTSGKKSVTRIVYYGDSHVASDDYTAPLRMLLQQRFGAAGLGFVLPARAERWYRRVGVSFGNTQGFRAERVRERATQTVPLGVYGLALHADRGVASTRFALTGTQPGFGATRIALYYATRPGGGSFQATLDERAPIRVSTEGEVDGYGRLDFAALDGPHAVELRTEADGPVTLLGAVLERDEPGVVLDMLGIPGARVRSQLQWTRSLRRKMLDERAPQLIVLAYGTNEAGDDEPIADYEADVRSVLAQLRSDAPAAGCLLVGPTDRPIKRGRTALARPRVAEITAVQRKLARTYGCGFFDTQHFMGGPASMKRWVRHRPQLGASDYVHLTPTGYEVLGAELYAAMEHGYLGYLSRKRGDKKR